MGSQDPTGWPPPVGLMSEHTPVVVSQQMPRVHSVGVQAVAPAGWVEPAGQPFVPETVIMLHSPVLESQQTMLRVHGEQYRSLTGIPRCGLGI